MVRFFRGTATRFRLLYRFMAAKAYPEPTDPLFDLELRIARRADLLAGEQPPRGRSSLQCWLAAELEILGADALEQPPPLVKTSSTLTTA